MSTLTETLPFAIHPVVRSRRPDIDFTGLAFGLHPTDHLFQAEYQSGAWMGARLEPFGALTLSPFTLALHYGQSVFEGLKAFRRADGQVTIFRPDLHHQRLNRSLARLEMPPVPWALFRDALRHLVRLDHHWIPEAPDGALYLRPLVFASEARIGIKAADTYSLLVMAAPGREIYQHPLRMKVETDFIRAAPGGTGAAKCAGNYAGALHATQRARAEGFDQVLWTDAIEHEYIEESGTMNVMFVLGDTLVTPPLTDTILAGVTRDSLLTLARAADWPVEERSIGWPELEKALRAGQRVEAFGVGTAAVVAPIASISIQGREYATYTGADARMHELRFQLEMIRAGLAPDPYGWNDVVTP